jgi:hypothetical protein
MSLSDNLQYKLENAALYFQGGVRRNILIIGGICLVLIVPFYFLGQLASGLYKQVWYNNKDFFIAKNTVTKDFIISSTQVAPLINGQNDLYVSIDNKANPEIGYFPWVYTLQSIDANGIITSQERTNTYLLPGDVTYVLSKNRDVGAVKLNLIKEPGTVAVNYNPNANKLLKKPNITTLTKTVKPSTSNPDEIELYAEFRNDDIVTIGTVDVLYIVRDTQESVVGVGKFSFGGFVPGSKRELIQSYPKPKDREAKDLEVRINVNYLDSNNIRFGN